MIKRFGILLKHLYLVANKKSDRVIRQEDSVTQLKCYKVLRFTIVDMI